MSPEYPWYHRVQVQAEISWTLLPEAFYFRRWLFRCEGWFVKPGDDLNIKHLPQAASKSYPTCFISADRKAFTARIVWIAGHLKVCGLDIGVGFYYRQKRDDSVMKQYLEVMHTDKDRCDEQE